jgi:nifR3 family TIM-barrel protein
MSDALTAALKNNPFVLAPMAGITDCAFRSFMKEMGASIVVTELVSANGLDHDSQKTRDLMKFEPEQHPVGVQLFGETPEIIARGARYVEERGADFVDLNFGCPVSKIVKKGAGAACLREPARLAEILRAVKKAIAIPLTIKIRTGWDEDSRNAVEIAHIAHNEGVHWVAIHGRTRAQAYTGRADWDFIAQVKAQAKLPILGNGDIQSARQANSRLQESGCDGVLIGRGCLKNPWIFRESLKILNRDFTPAAKKDFRAIFERLKFHLQAHCDERGLLIQIKKFSSWYSSGYPNASAFRKRLFSAKDAEEVFRNVEEYFAEISECSQADTSGEAFLMGGHG